MLNSGKEKGCNLEVSNGDLVTANKFSLQKYTGVFLQGILVNLIGSLLVCRSACEAHHGIHNGGVLWVDLPTEGIHRKVNPCASRRVTDWVIFWLVFSSRPLASSQPTWTTSWPHPSG